ncbi:MAG: hypothetical protein AAAB13_18840, partial [Pseudomonas sp.]
MSGTQLGNLRCTQLTQITGFNRCNLRRGECRQLSSGQRNEMSTAQRDNIRRLKSANLRRAQ